MSRKIKDSSLFAVLRFPHVDGILVDEIFQLTYPQQYNTADNQQHTLAEAVLAVAWKLRLLGWRITNLKSEWTLVWNIPR